MFGKVFTLWVMGIPNGSGVFIFQLLVVLCLASGCFTLQVHNLVLHNKFKGTPVQFSGAVSPSSSSSPALCPANSGHLGFPKL